MKGYNVYSKVQQLREAGFSQCAMADTLKINRKTVKRYWDMSIEEYEAKHQTTIRIRALDAHRDLIIFWLRQYPSLIAAQVCDWLKYLKSLLTEIPKHMDDNSLDFLEDLLPWSEHIPEECRKKSEYDQLGSIRGPVIYSVKVRVVVRLLM